jgi:hypothetical protein
MKKDVGRQKEMIKLTVQQKIKTYIIKKNKT